MVRILLIEACVERPENFVFQAYPPQGLMYLASFLRKVQPGHDIRIMDLLIQRCRAEDRGEQIREFGPDIVGIHAMNFQASALHRAASFIKSALPEACVVAGGPYPSAEPSAVLADENIDAAVFGEGEVTFAELVERVTDNGDIAGLPGTMVRRNGKLVQGPSREFIAEVDSIPFPAWDLVDLSAFYTDRVLNQNDICWRREVTTVFTSRACPFQCIYCHNIFGKKFRPRSPDNVMAEINALYNDHGIREVHFIDDCFNLDMARAKAILQGIIESGMDLKLAFPNGLRGDRIDGEMIELMVSAGTYKINLGIESGSQRVQKLIRKGLDLGKIERAIQEIDQAGIFIHGFFMLGFPGESEPEMRDTMRFACRSRLHTAGFALLSPFPGTEVRRMAEDQHMEVHYDPNDTSYSRVSANLSAVSDKRLIRLHRLAHWRFYFSLKRILRIIKAMPRKSDIFRLVRAHFWLKFV
jgi:anaerobic magnesium-protoporphyrin IX monomethyl ester cyclase